MMIHVPKVLTPEQFARCREVIEKAAWVDGRVTAGHQSSKVKNNLQLPEGSPEARELGGMVVEALARNNLFMSAVLPKPSVLLQRALKPIASRTVASAFARTSH